MTCPFLGDGLSAAIIINTIIFFEKCVYNNSHKYIGYNKDLLTTLMNPLYINIILKPRYIETFIKYNIPNKNYTLCTTKE
jgi:hypothetical protein